MTIIGFTGAREGMKKSSKALIKDFIIKGNYIEFHHGDCVGADEQFHLLVDSLNIKDAVIHIHPPITSRGYKANCASKLNRTKILLHDEKSFLHRNRDIVNSSDLIIATPKSLSMKHLGGTWWTVNYALEKHKEIMILLWGKKWKKPLDIVLIANAN